MAKKKTGRKVSAAQLKKLQALCAHRAKLQGELKATNESIAGIRRELEALLKLSNVPSGVNAQARVIPCATGASRKRKKTAKKAPPRPGAA